MSTNQISKPVEDSNTEENKIKEFENWIMYFVIEKESDADAVWHFVMVAYQLQKLPTLCMYATSYLDLLISLSNSSAVQTLCISVSPLVVIKYINQLV